MEERELKILQAASNVFMKYGIKSVNMDDLARHLGVSKKTLYLYVKDKEDMLRKSVQMFCEREDQEIKTICERGLNAIDESLEIMKWVTGVLQEIHPSVHFDMQKYHPEVHKMMMDNRFTAIYDCISNNIKKGQKEGFYRKDINADIITRVYITRIDVIFDSNVFGHADYTPTHLYTEIFRYHIRGIASDKGHQYLSEKQKSLK